MSSKKLKAHELRSETPEKLEKDLIALKEELAQLRVNQVTGASGKLARMYIFLQQVQLQKFLVIYS